MNKLKKEANKRLWKILLVVSIVGFFLCVLVWGISWSKRRTAEQKLENLQNMTMEQETASTESEQLTDVLAEMGIEVPEKNIDFEAIKEENPDIYAWIYVPGTKVDYPILQHPTDDTYYLNHNLDGSKGYPGCIYTELLNSKDFLDPNTVLYGHNMDDDTMFGSLHDFADEEFFGEDHYIYVYTPENVYVYQIFAAYEYPGIHLLYNFDVNDPEVFADYLEGIYEIKGRVVNVREDIVVNAEQHIITLSTCTTDHEDSLRFLVQGVLLNAEE